MNKLRITLGIALLAAAAAAEAQTTWTVATPTYTSVVSGTTYSTQAKCVNAVESNTVPPGTSVTYHCHPNGDVVVTGTAAGSTPPLAITTGALAGGTVGVAYSQALTASGGLPPDTWAATGLPSGLALSGATIAGTPGTPGTSMVGLLVTDSASHSASTTLPLVIAAGGGGGGACTQAGSTSITGAFDSLKFGNYFVNNDNFNGGKYTTWAKSADCWGATNTQGNDLNNVSGYPSATRGWSQNATIMQQAGGNSWTVKSGMGVSVGQLTKAKVHWKFTAPTSTASARWLGLMDNYFHSTSSPSPSQFPPKVDLMVDQAIIDTGYYAAVIAGDHAGVITVGGATWSVYIDDADEAGYHSSGGHTIHLFRHPISGGTIGAFDAVTDLAPIVQLFMKSNPTADNGQPLTNAKGVAITAPLITSDLFLNAVNAGWEQDRGGTFVTSEFCVAMQSEPDCP